MRQLKYTIRCLIILLAPLTFSPVKAQLNNNGATVVMDANTIPVLQSNCTISDVVTVYPDPTYGNTWVKHTNR